MSPAPPGPSTAWGWCVAAGVVLAIAYSVGPLVGLGGTIRHFVVAVAGAVGTLAVLSGLARHRQAMRAPWFLVCGGLFAFTVGKTLFAVTNLLETGALAALAQVGYLAQYVLFGLGLLVLIRRRALVAARERGALLDTAVSMVAAALLCWVYLVEPALGGEPLALAYLVLDLLLLALAVRLLASPGAGSGALRLLAGGAFLLVAADLLVITTRASQHETLTWHSAVWILAYAVLGASALHPSVRWVDQPAPVRRSGVSVVRLAVLGAAALVPSAVLVAQAWRGEPIDAPAIGTASVVLLVLVLVRLRALMPLQRADAITDGLTGLHARDLMDELIRIEVARSMRAGADLAVLVVDADHFRLINEAYGQSAGDLVLVELANRVRAACRRGDVVARDRDDRLLVLLPSVGSREVARLAEDLRDRVSTLSIELGDTNRVRLTVSIGFACLPSDVTTAEELVPFADNALRTAKAAGRNRTAGRHGAVHPELHWR
jgi:diguanylate cyclase (GGDEF)-like protein